MASTSTAPLVARIPNPLRRRPITCSSPPPHCRSSAADAGRRSVSIGLILLHSSFVLPDHADAANPFDKYVKRKKLEPLEAYVPAVLLSEAQFKDLEKFLDAEQPQYDVSRSLLRSGPAASLRVNIRAVAQYATDDGNGNVASDAVDRCLRALEDLDSMLLHAIRNDPTATVGSMKSKISIALGALDRFDNDRLVITKDARIRFDAKKVGNNYKLQDSYVGLEFLSSSLSSEARHKKTGCRVESRFAFCKPCHHQCLIREGQLPMRIEIQAMRKKKASLKLWTQS